MSLIDDPRLTAYALDEMRRDDRVAFEAELANDAAARAEIDAIRTSAARLRGELHAELVALPVAPTSTETSVPPHAIFRRRVLLAAAAAVAIGGLVAAMIPMHGPSRPSRLAHHVPSTEPATYSIPATNQPPTTEPPDVGAVPIADLLVYTPDSSDLLRTRVETLQLEPKPEGTLTLGDAQRPGERRMNGADPTLTVAGGGPDFTSPIGAEDSILVPSADELGQPVRILGGAVRAPEGVVLDQDVGRQKQLPRLRALQDRSDLSPQYNYQDQPTDRATTESYTTIHDNAFLSPRVMPLSTFGVDVDTASFSNVRRYLSSGALPPADAVRIEELINYFPTSDAPPTDGQPFSVRTEVGACPWAPTHRLVRVALKGRVVENAQRPPSNLVFLVDVSGSMNEPNKLPLVKRSLRKLVGQLGENDRVAIVVYAGNSGLALPSTSASNKAAILNAIDTLEAGGSTNGGQGIELAYATAGQYFIAGGANRVILCTDGDFNVGIVDRTALTTMIAEKAKAGVFLNVLGFGTGNTKDNTMEGLADKGNGVYGYIDTDREADKVFVQQIGGTLVTIAKDVKLQLEFNPATVQSYRLIGYENRVMAAQDFNNDLKDSGDIGAGHSVVALYEIEPAGSGRLSDPATMHTEQLKYQRAPDTQPVADATNRDELLTLKLRFKKPDAPLEQGTSELIETIVKDRVLAPNETSQDFRFAAAVAGFGMLLRDSPHRGSCSWGLVRTLASDGVGADVGGYRSEFLSMIDTARTLKPQ